MFNAYAKAFAKNMLKNHKFKPVKDFKRAKIVATFGPSVATAESVEALITAGANAIRLNFSHDNHEGHAKAIKLIRQASKKLDKPVAIIQDLQGPKIRLGDFDSIFEVEKGQSFKLRYNADFDRENTLPTQYDLSKKVKRGERIYFVDGKIKGSITSVKDGIVHVRAENAGELKSRKGINLPDTDFGGDIITAKDKEDIAFASVNDIDFVALSFVQNAGDVRKLQRLLNNLGSSAKVIAKIETRAAADNVDEISQVADGLMVARGDLAIETNVEEVPIIQRQIVRLGIKYAKPVIIATQMLASMTDHHNPTRAEASDVATAVLMGADALMLSDETAVGHNAPQAVKTMKRIIRYAESHVHEKIVYSIPDELHTRQTAICKALIDLSYDVGSVAIVAETKSGATARKIASYRPDLPILAVTSSAKVAQQLTLVYGVKVFIRKDEAFQASHLTEWLHKNKALKKGDIVVIASGKRPGVVGTTDTIKVRIIE